MKALLDTNALFSGLGFKGPENKIIWLAILGKLELTVSEYILDELIRNVQVKFTGPRRKKALELIERLVVSDAVEVKTLKDYEGFLDEAKGVINEKDAPIVACAMLSDIDVLLTGDKGFRKKAVKERICVMNASAFLGSFHF